MAEFDDDRIKRIVALADKADEEKNVFWNVESIFERLDNTIIGNERYKKSLSISLADFMSDAKIRNHLLVIGPSGTGKSYLLEQCLPDFGLPYFFIDASGLVPSGYKGNTLQAALEDYFRMNMTASRRCVIVLDEFDKISEKANGGDTHKSHSIQSELLTLIQGKQEGAIDTRNALWILAGAFAFADEMKSNKPRITKPDLLKYGFKNELLGRITKITLTDIPTTEQVVRRVVNDKVLKSFSKDLLAIGYEVEFTDDAFLDLALAAQNPNFGMRIIPSIIAELKEQIIFGCNKGKVIISKEMIKLALVA